MSFFIFFLVVTLISLMRAGWHWHEAVTTVATDGLIFAIILDIFLFVWAGVMLYLKVKAGL